MMRTATKISQANPRSATNIQVNARKPSATPKSADRHRRSLRDASRKNAPTLVANDTAQTIQKIGSLLKRPKTQVPAREPTAPGMKITSSGLPHPESSRMRPCSPGPVRIWSSLGGSVSGTSCSPFCVRDRHRSLLHSGFCRRCSETAQADQQERNGEEALVDGALAFPADEHSPKGAEPGEAPLDGLLTNDKFCLTRTAMLPLSWSRQPLRLRTVSLQNRGSVHAGGTDEAHAHVERPTPANSAQRRADSLGSSLSAPAAVDDRSRGSSDSARPSAGGR
jgi:hypothetical protein